MTEYRAVAISSDASDESKLIYGDPVTAKLVELVEFVAVTPSTVMLTGESGVGKEVFAHYIHRRSKRRDGPFISLNCAAIPATLLESELFGHERGAFSGADERRVGHFERANGGTIFLDEITELPVGLQAKLLRVVQERSIRRIGGTDVIELDLRIVAASNRDLQEAIDSGIFRRDLYYRLNVFPIHIPPLRHRRGDIRPLVEAFAARYAARLENSPRLVAAGAVEKLMTYAYPGNVRELMNILERAMIISSAHQQDAIGPEFLQLDDERRVFGSTDEDFAEVDSVRFVPGNEPLTDVRMRVILKTLEHFDGNRTKTAEALGVSLRTVRNKIRDYREKGVEVPEP